MQGEQRGDQRHATIGEADVAPDARLESAALPIVVVTCVGEVDARGPPHDLLEGADETAQVGTVMLAESRRLGRLVADLAGLATPLVLSVHSIVSMDFATSLVPGWHATIFPPYFVAGAIYSGFAMVMTLAIRIRAA